MRVLPPRLDILIDSLRMPHLRFFACFRFLACRSTYETLICVSRTRLAIKLNQTASVCQTCLLIIFRDRLLRQKIARMAICSGLQSWGRRRCAASTRTEGASSRARSSPPCRQPAPQPAAQPLQFCWPHNCLTILARKWARSLAILTACRSVREENARKHRTQIVSTTTHEELTYGH